MQILLLIFWRERRTLLQILYILAVSLVTAEFLLYEAERTAPPEAFGSMPQALWWALVTLTTVGYGDVVPVTVVGKIIAAVVMLLGLGVAGLWSGLFAAAFLLEFRRRDFEVTGWMLAHFPLFHDLSVSTLAEIARLLQPLTAPPRHAVIRGGEEDGGVYFVLSGAVEVERAAGPALLEEGPTSAPRRCSAMAAPPRP